VDFIPDLPLAQYSERRECGQTAAEVSLPVLRTGWQTAVRVQSLLTFEFTDWSNLENWTNLTNNVRLITLVLIQFDVASDKFYSIANGINEQFKFIDTEN
jgi:hypothetical protein